jgi:hypothetical protein
MNSLNLVLDKRVVKNAIVLDSSAYCNCTVWMKVMEQLKELTNIRTRYFFYYDKEQMEIGIPDFKKSMGDDVFYHNVFEAWKGRGFYTAPKRNVLDNQLLSNIAKYELTCLKMMDRLDPLGESFSFTHRQYFFRDLLLVWLDIIDDMDIQVVFSPDVPHKIYDYILYVAAKIRKIEFVSFQKTPFSDSSFVLDSVDHIPSYINEFLVNAKENKINSVEHKVSEILGSSNDYRPSYMVELEKMNRTKSVNSLVSDFCKRIQYYYKKGYFSYPFPIVRKVKGRMFSPWTLNVAKGYMPQESRTNVFTNITNRIKINSRVKRFQIAYQKNVESVCLSNQKYVYVPLHYQPEETTSPTGGVYVDQLLVIEMLDKLLPNDYLILVKEHAIQFYKAFESTCARDNIFYRRLSNFSERVKTIDVSVKSFELINEATAVVTVSGSVGFEAILKGKPVLVFGRTWYEPLPGVRRVENEDEFIQHWNDIETGILKFSIDDVKERLNKLSGLFIEARHSGAYFKISDRTDESSVENIVNGIITHFKNKTNYSS